MWMRTFHPAMADVEKVRIQRKVQMMARFDYSFEVDAPVEAVSNFHKDTSVLKVLSPPPIYAQIHDFEPLGEGSKADFTLWFGPLPVHWQAVHSDVTVNGFTDTQVKGPLKRWQHQHRFSAIDEETTLVSEHIEYEHDAGWRGLWSRLLFSKLGLYMLFTARKIITRRSLAKIEGEK
jgi:ligand-binding SRPBCC domain-containing protein